MSGDYISRAAAINKIMENIVHQDCHDANLHNIGLRKAMSAIDSIPAADVVEVVRCRDCMHYVKSDQVNGEFMCVKDADWCVEDGCYYGFTDYPPAEFYCAAGERKDGGQDDAPAGPYDLLYEEGGPDA